MGFKGSHQSKMARGGVMVHSSWHSWNPLNLQNAPEGRRLAKIAGQQNKVPVGTINCRPDKYSASGWLVRSKNFRFVSKLKPRKLAFQWRKPCIKIPPVQKVMPFSVKPRRFGPTRLQPTTSPPPRTWTWEILECKMKPRK